MTLTICVPTYNRAADVGRLIENLGDQIGDATDVTVLVSDNCSSDETTVVLGQLKLTRPWLRVHHQPVNLGPNANIRWLVRNAPESDYLWVFCDDDTPLDGALDEVRRLLAAERPAWLWLPHRFDGWETQPMRRSPEPGEIVRHATSTDMWCAFDHWLGFLTASVVRADALRAAVEENWSANAFQPLLWLFLAGREGPCVAAPRHLVHGCLDTTWSDRASEYLTVQFTRLYDDGLHTGLTPEQFAHGLNGYYGRDFDMFEHWRNVGLERLEAAVRRFPHSAGLRDYLWRFAVEANRPDVLATLAWACEQSGADATAQALIAEGEERFAAGDLVAAAQTFDRATGAAPTLVSGWNDLAVVLAQMGDARAWFALERALFVAPADPDALINAATLLANQGDFGAAVQRLESVLRHDPGNAAAGELLAALTAA